ncbi:MAG: hypothetical protein KatS3mg003_0630 [Candidatus Nitrosocaldaceae archaeon]|nr:MAG: hypothetical protein KatS3mg003_0630 [Candidatus Nitrosocaldaceae archaeon]
MTQILLSSLKRDDLATLINNDPSWLKGIRGRAFEYYQLLPNEVSSLYNKYTSATELKQDSIFFDLELKEPSQSVLERFEEVQGASILSVNNNIYDIKVPKELKDKGVIIEKVTDALNKHEQLKSIINKIDPLEDKFLALEHALFNSGIFIYIPKNIELEEPITIIHEQSRDGASSIIRNIFYLDNSSRASVVHELYSDYDGDKQQVLFELNESYLASNAEFNHIILQAMNEKSAHVANIKAYVNRDARLNSYLGGFGSLLSRYKIDNSLEEEGASIEHMETVFGSNNQIFDVTSNLLHKSPSTRGRVIAKNVVRDKARSLFKGMIRIEKDAKNSESYLAGHAIILNKGAKADSIPSLEIENNEVKATHSASVAQIDEEQIFYLMARGFSKEDAKRMIVLGFVEPLLRRLSPEARAWTKYLIESKWYGRPLIIRSDEIMEEFLEVERESKRIETDLFEKHYKYR